MKKTLKRGYTPGELQRFFKDARETGKSIVKTNEGDWIIDDEKNEPPVKQPEVEPEADTDTEKRPWWKIFGN